MHLPVLVSSQICFPTVDDALHHGVMTKLLSLSLSLCKRLVVKEGDEGSALPKLELGKPQCDQEGPFPRCHSRRNSLKRLTWLRPLRGDLTEDALVPGHLRHGGIDGNSRSIHRKEGTDGASACQTKYVCMYVLIVKTIMNRSSGTKILVYTV